MSSRRLAYRIAKTPVLGRIVLAVFRLGYGFRYVCPPVAALFKWVFTSREIFNYTYDLTPMNRRYLASFLAAATGAAPETFETYFRELEEDAGLRDHVAGLARSSEERFQADPCARYGRRIAWYALVRWLKPRVVLETGVDKGLGACVIAAALLRNRREGRPGRYLGTDINPKAGYLLTAPYDSTGEIRYGDSIDSIGRLDLQVDLYINDSDHSAAYEAREYAAMMPRLAPSSFIIGDNAHVTEELSRFCRATGRNFLYFQEKPLGHWYPGGGIGLGYAPTAATLAAKDDVF
ncbi:MAG: class I SAM-dependent methyltransferase [Kiritimatiellia bacterium]